MLCDGEIANAKKLQLTSCGSMVQSITKGKNGLHDSFQFDRIPYLIHKTTKADLQNRLRISLRTLDFNCNYFYSRTNDRL